MDEVNETGRLEAFSDGVFAIAITLLVLDLHTPPQPLDDQALLKYLIEQMPRFFAFVTSFAAIGVMWLNHHRLFTHIKHTDHTLKVINLLVLFIVVLIPFPTALVAEYITHPEQHLAAIIYSGTYLLMAVCFNLLWRYAAAENRLLGSQVDQNAVQTITAQYRFGPLFYVAPFVLAWISTPASLALNLLLAIFFALPGQRVRMLSRG